MRFQDYPAYKSSGVEWLGDVPAHWSVKRLKFTARYSVSNVNKVPGNDELPVRLCNYTDVYHNERIHPEMGLMETTATADEIRRFGLQVGDVLLTKDSEEWTDIAVPAIVERGAADLVCGYHLAIVRADERSLRGSFLLRLLQSLPINRHFQVSADGVTRFGLPKSAIGDVWLPLPPPEEQAVVASFLDRETARIDTLVAKKRELIEKLEEKRAALIARTVTRGLPPDAARAAGFDPHPKLKPSGIDWLGAVPQHWQVAQLRRQCAILDCKHRTVPFVEDGIPVASIQEVHGLEVNLEDAKKTTEEEYRVMIEGGRAPRLEDVLFSRNATVGEAALVATADRFCMGQDVCLIRAPRHHGRFLLYVFRSRYLSEQVESLMIGSTFRRINVEQIKAFLVCMPSPREQRAIVTFLDRESAKIDRLIAKVGEAIDHLLEYRSTLITAAVTGKIDVRGMRDAPTESGGTLQP